MLDFKFEDLQRYRTELSGPLKRQLLR